MIHTNNPTVKVLVLIIVLIITMACKNEKQQSKVEESQSKVEKSEVKYTINYLLEETATTPIFNYKIVYTDENENEQEEEITELPWAKKFDVTAPFRAKFSVDYILKKEANIPDLIRIERKGVLRISKDKDAFEFSEINTKFTIAKAKLETLLQKNPLILLSYEIKEQ